ncbi:MAG: hypothetical protein ACLQU2_28290 [Candidatus Binataceae bacterium]
MPNKGFTAIERNCPAATPVLLFLLVMAAGLAAAGCGSSSSGPPVLVPAATATATKTATATATPVPFAPAKAVPLAVTSDPNLPHWFILVNGSSVPSPMALFTPTVLTVNGTGPAGSPNPNSGTGVGVAPMNFVPNPVPQASPSAVPTEVPFAFTGTQVWQAVPGTQPGFVYLRNGESFVVDRTNNPVGSLMLGYGATEAVLELGYLPSWSTAIYLDQSASPTGDNSCFQQWSYDLSTAQLTNCNGGQLYNSTPTAGVGSGTSAPGNQWYALPNYELAQIVTRPNSNPSFPAWTPNQQNAYNWVSQQISATGPCLPVAVGVGTNQQTLCFSGVRNEYQNAAFNPGTTNANIQNLPYPSATPSPFFAPGDLAAVQSQLNLELNYVTDVRALLGNARTVMATVFWENTNVLTKVAADLGVSASAKPFAVAAQIVEGALYTALSALGNVNGVFGVAANVIQTAFDTTAVSHPTFEQEVGGTVGELAGNLNTQFNYLSDALTTDYNTIVYDWGRLSEVGPKTLQSGYWGFFWPDDLTGIIVPYMVNGYQITVMRALLPLVYNLHPIVGQTSASANPYGVTNPPSYAQYAWDFGSGATTAAPTSSQTDWRSYYNQGYWETGAVTHSYPDSTVMQSDLLDLGANPFEIFTGINGWSGNGTGTVYYLNLSCMGVAVTLFNDTPSELWVNYTTKQGEVSGPGDDFGAVFAQGFSSTYKLSGLKGTAWAELRPYGYTTIFFAQDNVTPTNQTGSVEVFDTSYSTTNPVASFEEGQDGCTGDSETNIHSGSSTADNYSWAGGLKLRGQSSGEPGGVWGTLINSTLSPSAAQR